MNSEPENGASNIKPLLNKWFLKPLKENPILAILVAGLFLAVLGSGPTNNLEILDPFPWAPGLIRSLGFTVVGAGVFAFLIKTSQFADHFKKILLDVLYDPNSLLSNKDLRARWEAITEAILGSLLPATHAAAASMISERYFDEELQYHFEDMHWKIRFTIKDDGHTLCVDQWAGCHICPSPNHPNAELSQRVKIRGGGNAELKELTLGSRELVKAGKIGPEFNDHKANRHIEIKVPLTDVAESHGKVKYRRHLFFEQDLKQEPYFQLELGRFSKGCQIEVESPPDFQLLFNGDLEPELENVSRSQSNDGQFHWLWEVAPKEKLLLPGHSCTILLIRLQES